MRRGFPQSDYRGPGRQQGLFPRAEPVLHLHRVVGGGGRKNPSLNFVEELIAASPSPPENFYCYPFGPIAAKLFFRRWPDALKAAVYFWSRRLDGAHHLTPAPVPGAPAAYRAEEETRLKALFASHARGLLDGEEVGRCKRKMEEVSGEIRRVINQLERHNRLGVAYELEDKRKQLADERKQLVRRLEEFRASVRCLLAYLGDGSVDVKEGEGVGVAQVFNLGVKINWSQIHCMMTRECRRLDEGLPVYAFRKDILQGIFSNQVMVLIGETGSGKSTQMVQFLADSGLASGSVVCTQPRRIAALSLAQRVREESSGCYADNTVIAYPTYSSFQGFNSNVIFTTDHCLLQHCMNNRSMDGISYIIVDEAHERSLNTDLLLALIKKNLLQRFDLRLVIMSATADASKLAEYFCGCCTIHVTGRTFPYEIRYVPDISAEALWTVVPKVNSASFASYVLDTIKMVNMIHKREGDGAILAFLTSQMEVEWACENFSDPSAVVLSMHGKLSSEEQNRVFLTYPGKRKVIFSTNVAETSLTIPGVKYVVDSGMVKEKRFEPSTGMDVLKVEWISQSSANQRAGRAGRTEPGKCYRLYSKGDFGLMKMHQEPEIRKVHLGVAVLRILALGMKMVDEFEFVDAPSSEAIETAIENLIQLRAVIRKNNSFELTDTGRSLVKLGIEPRLGKIILDCLHFGLRKEGLVLASVMLNSSSIFCRVGSEEDKFKADRHKLPFCHREGDLFTFLSVYKQWEEEQNKNPWCWQNSINAKSMRRCQENVLELENTLRHELNIIIPSYWLWNPYEPSSHDVSLKKVIMSSFPGNIAMHSGYDKLGYVVASTGQPLHLHPSCSLLAYGKKPNWVVYGEILSISNQYLVCVTAVDIECLYEIQPPLFDISLMESLKMCMNVISGVGMNLLQRLCGKFDQDLKFIVSKVCKVCMDDRIGIDVDFAKREIQVFSSAEDMAKVSDIVNDALECEMKWLMDECVEKSLFRGGPECSPSVALIGAGAEIRHLELEKRFLTVEISHSNANSRSDKELLLKVDQFIPEIANYQRYTSSGQDVGPGYSSKWGKITFLRPEAAQEAVAELNKMEFSGSLLKVIPIKAGDHKMLPFPGVRAKVCWPRRPTKGSALIKCAAEDAEFIVKDCFTLGIGGRYVNCQVSTKFRDCIFVTGLPRDITEAELYNAFLGATNRKIFEVQLLRGQAICGPPNAVCEEALVREIAPFMPNKHFPSHNFRVEVFNPEPKDHTMKAMITFDGRLHLEAAKALDHIEGRVLQGCLSWQRIQCQHVFQSSLSCPARIYSVIKKHLDSLLESFKHKKGVHCNLEVNESGSYRIRIIGNGTKTVADLRKPLEQLMRGKVVSHPSLTPLILQLLLSRDGISLLRSIEHETGTYIFYDRQNVNVKVFGPPDAIATTEEKLVSSLLSLHENKPLQIRLRGGTLQSDLMKDVVQRFGPDLDAIKEKVPGVDVSLNTRHHILFVRGTREQKQKVEEIISEVAQDSVGQDSSSEGSSCPICMCELEEPYKLEACGHDFCRSCLVEQFESAIRSRDGFPLRCTKQGCGKLILVVDFRSFLSGEKLEELFQASLGAFVASSGGNFRFCPSPDCPSVYRVASPNATIGMPFLCGACLVETCTNCHLEYHPFMSCERYKEYKDDPDVSLQEWRKGKEHVKDCPGCGNTIEKIEGCNHIECRCGRHICWVCLKDYDSSEECYAHLRSVHHAII